jgi:short-subunit dehydrogenase
VIYRALDLTDLHAIEGFVSALGAEGHRVDIVVNNAGESQSGPLEDLPIGALERVFRLNVLGPVHLTQLLLPAMREGGYGRVVMVGSMLASFPLAYRSSYVASKAAIKGFATAARFELSPFGVWLTTVEPGAVKTGISQRRTKYIAEGSPHLPSFRTMLRILDRDEKEGIAPARVARTILHAIEAERPDALYAVGNNASTVFALRRALPSSLVEGLVARKFGMSRSRDMRA